MDEIQFIPIELVEPHVFDKMVNMLNEHLEEYETCTALVKKRTAYLKWLQGNRTTITVIQDIINEFKDQL
jgi:hypothetical protein